MDDELREELREEGRSAMRDAQLGVLAAMTGIDCDDHDVRAFLNAMGELAGLALVEGYARGLNDRGRTTHRR